MSADFLPILAAFPDGPHAQSWEIWCEPCAVWHTHGPDAGWRSAHCVDYANRPRQRNQPQQPPWTQYYISDNHPYARIQRQRDRPKLEPLGWLLTGSVLA